MKKAIRIGIITGVLLSFILIALFYLRTAFPPDSNIVNLSFPLLFFAIVTIALRVAMKRYSKTEKISLKYFILTGFVAGVITSIVVSVASYAHARFIQPDYLSFLVERSRENWTRFNYSLDFIAAQLRWDYFKSPFNFAMNNLMVGIFLFLILSLTVACIYYLAKRSKMQSWQNSRNPELLY